MKRHHILQKKAANSGFFYAVKHNYFFQKAGEKSKKIVKSSKRPINITNARYHLQKSGIAENVPLGPVAPKPGPTLLIDVTTAPMASSRFIPAKFTTITLTMINKT